MRSIDFEAHYFISTVIADDPMFDDKPVLGVRGFRGDGPRFDEGVTTRCHCLGF